jgi:hypothetical protein
MEFSMKMNDLSMGELQNIDGGTNWWAIAGGVVTIVATVAVCYFVPVAIANPAGMKVAESIIAGGVVAIGYGMAH